MTDNDDSISSEQSTASMTSRVDILEARLEVLKDDVEKRDKSVFKRVSQWGGLIALVLSITLGTLSVIDKSIWEPVKKREASLSKLQDIVGQVTKVNSELVSLTTTLSPEKLAPIVSTQNGVKYTLAKQGAAIIDKYTNFVNTETLLLFASEFLHFQDLEKTDHYANLGFKAAENDFMRAASKRYMADAKMLSQDGQKIIESRKLYSQALGHAKLVPIGQRYWVIGNIYRDWTLGEAFNNQCDKAVDLFKKMLSALSVPNANQAQTAIKGQILTQIKSGRTCDLTAFVLP